MNVIVVTVIFSYNFMFFLSPRPLYVTLFLFLFILFLCHLLVMLTQRRSLSCHSVSPTASPAVTNQSLTACITMTWNRALATTIHLKINGKWKFKSSL